jgi:hypothetical protein
MTRWIPLLILYLFVAFSISQSELPYSRAQPQPYGYIWNMKWRSWNDAPYAPNSYNEPKRIVKNMFAPMPVADPVTVYRQEWKWVGVTQPWADEYWFSYSNYDR